MFPGHKACKHLGAKWLFSFAYFRFFTSSSGRTAFSGSAVLTVIWVPLHISTILFSMVYNVLPLCLANRYKYKFSVLWLYMQIAFHR